jgi:predicted aspartyl protease
VHGAVCDHRVKISLDTGASTSMISLELARKLGLKLNFDDRLWVEGAGGITTHLTARAKVKITLGSQVV